MNNRSKISIPVPKFALYQLVTLHWNGKEHRTEIVRRWFDADDGCWLYETTLSETTLDQLYPEGVLEQEEVEPEIDALLDALQYGQEDLDLVIKALNDEFKKVQEAAYSLLQDRKDPKVKLALQAYNPYLFFECLCTIQTHCKIYSIAISSDRQTLVTANSTDGGKGTLTRVWNLQSQQEPHTFPSGSYTTIHDVAISSDSQILGIASFGDFVNLWNIQTWQKVYTSSFNLEPFWGAKFSADGQTFVTRYHKGDQNGFKLRDVKTAEDYISYIELSKSHRYAEALCSDSWNWETGDLICTLKGHVGDVICAIISSHLQLLLGGTDEHTIIVWNMWTGQKLSILNGHSSPVNCSALSSDGQTLVSSSDDGMIKVWGLP